MSASTDSSLTAQQDQPQQIQLLASTDDDYDGVIVEISDLVMDSTTFLSILRPSISNWKQQVLVPFIPGFFSISSY